MRRFIHRENIKHFRLLLEATLDENERQIILKLIAEEEAKATALDLYPDPSPKTRAL